VVEAEPPAVPRPVAAWGRHQGGRIAEWRILEDLDEILEIEPAYVVRAPYRLWKDLLSRRADPVQAALTGRVRVEATSNRWFAAPSTATSSRGRWRSLDEFPDEVRR